MARTTIIAELGMLLLILNPHGVMSFSEGDQDVFRTVWGNFLCE
jgi:hypothetical protein